MFNPYYNYNYNPNYDGYAAQAQNQQSGGFVPVPSEEEARNYPVRRGSSVTFRDENLPYIYIKTLGMLDKMAHTLKSLKTIDAMEGYSEDDGYHHDAMSYARGRGTYADRDSMGRYASESRYMDNDYPERRR